MIKKTSIDITLEEKEELLRRSKITVRNGAKNEAELYIRFCLKCFDKVLTEDTAIDKSGNLVRFTGNKLVK